MLANASNCNPILNFFIYAARHRDIRLGAKYLFTCKVDILVGSLLTLQVFRLSQRQPWRQKRRRRNRCCRSALAAPMLAQLVTEFRPDLITPNILFYAYLCITQKAIVIYWNGASYEHVVSARVYLWFLQSIQTFRKHRTKHLKVRLLQSSSDYLLRAWMAFRRSTLFPTMHFFRLFVGFSQICLKKTEYLSTHSTLYWITFVYCAI